MPGTTAHSQVTLFSETDLHGTITFVNDAFCEISRYSRTELLGKPHNIIRHPDMPKMLFQRWWGTIKRGEVFRAILKNRSKDGTHYWVQATVMPVFDTNGVVVKYIAARHLIADEREALALYAQQAKVMNLEFSFEAGGGAPHRASL